ncbi:MAG: penicillin-binding protein 1A [Bacteroidia bacterium]|nr:MAG: penicillin-binding protein 1A [Bacteroidia bacterium]
MDGKTYWQNFQKKLKELYHFDNQFKKYRNFVLYFFSLNIILFVILAIYVIWEMPPLNILENPKSNLSTQILDRNGKILGSLFDEENRIYLKSTDAINDTFIKALIATEDIRFYQHAGIDFVGTMNILFSIITLDPRGGSSITQQLARNLYSEVVGNERSSAIKTIFRKFKEAIVAIYLERNYTKEEILKYYLNTVPFGSNTYGVRAASKFYFQKEFSKLKAHEAALIVALLKGPSFYNPFKYPERALNRRNTVIEQMQKYELISEKEAIDLKKRPLDVVGKGANLEYHSEGLAPYFREHIRLYIKQWASKNGYNIYRDGLRVYTTIDSKMQEYAEEAMKEHLKDLQIQFDNELKTLKEKPWEADSSIIPRAMRHSARYQNLIKEGLNEKQILKNFKTPIPMKVFVWDETQNYEKDTILSPWDSLIYYAKFLQPGMVAIDPSTGRILTWVGGIHHKFFKYDHVEKGKRQVGSTFKPFVYAAAFDNGFHPCDKELNQPPAIPSGDGKVWRPENSDKSTGGEVTLRYALANSLNTVSARIIHKVGPPTVVEYASKMGINSPIEPVYSIALGTMDLNVLELTASYGTILNLGKWMEPYFIERIEDKNGNILFQHTPNSREALSPNTAYLMIDMLKTVISKGTGSALRWIAQLPWALEVAGKTGTTQNHSDGWFVGFTPHFVAGVWVGCDDRNVHFQKINYGQGAVMAMPIWGKFVKKVYDNPALGYNIYDKFRKPADFKDDNLDCKKYYEKNKTDVTEEQVNFNE